MKQKVISASDTKAYEKKLINDEFTFNSFTQSGFFAVLIMYYMLLIASVGELNGSEFTFWYLCNSPLIQTLELLRLLGYI